MSLVPLVAPIYQIEAGGEDNRYLSRVAGQHVKFIETSCDVLASPAQRHPAPPPSRRFAAGLGAAPQVEPTRNLASRSHVGLEP